MKEDDHIPTNVEMQAFVMQRRRYLQSLLEKVGCCGDRDCSGNCRLTGFRCRVVAKAIELFYTNTRY